MFYTKVLELTKEEFEALIFSIKANMNLAAVVGANHQVYVLAALQNKIATLAEEQKLYEK